MFAGLLCAALLGCAPRIAPDGNRSAEAEPAPAAARAAGNGEALALLLRREAARTGFGPAPASTAVGPPPGRQPLVEALFAAYEARDWRSVWFPGGGAPQAVRLASAAAMVERAADHGLDPADYRLPAPASDIAKIARNAAPGTLAALEIAAMSAVLAFAHDAAVGWRAARLTDPNVFAELEPFDAQAVIRRLADPARDPADTLRALFPDHAPYRALQAALAAYRARAAHPEPPAVPEGPSLRLGARDGRVAALRARLAYFGDLAPQSGDAARFDPEVDRAVRRHQERHGLEPDGVVGPQTLAALNVPIAARLQQLRLNLERWRWLPHDLGAAYVLANIAAFEVRIVEEGAVLDRIRAVVGKPFRMTPVFSDAITYVEVNPTWTVPPRIAGQDLLPKIRDNPTFLADEGYELFDGWGPDAARLDPSSVDWASVSPDAFPYKLRQRPGPSNALGRVKIMFPNRFDVYLHDSPARALFERRVRAFSSGCIRLERPFDLVDWLMRRTGGPERAEIEAIRAAGETRVVPLRSDVPVHLIYAAAWAEPDGTVQFRSDVYGRDALLQAALVR
ncbi:MAG: L,D-transpeptidase family protein [Alphaproteobacteria bacterium]|nr:L,D-transpeptidase family protein [Alphaproteobacteria bacterium]